MKRLVNALVFLLIAVGGGLGSAWYMVEIGSPLTTEKKGPWRLWTTAGRPDADPYTRANIARTGRLPLSSATAHYYVARNDSQGRRLLSTCEYLIDGSGPTALWWSLAVYDDRGSLLANPVQRYAYNSSTVLRVSNGRYQIVLARQLQPGNWLPVSGSRPLVLILRLYLPEASAADVQTGEAVNDLPEIRRGQCRG